MAMRWSPPTRSPKPRTPRWCGCWPPPDATRKRSGTTNGRATCCDARWRSRRAVPSTTPSTASVASCAPGRGAAASRAGLAARRANGRRRHGDGSPDPGDRTGACAGRDRRMRRRSQHALAARAEPRLLLFTGEPGIGKTCLLDRLAADALAAGRRGHPRTLLRSRDGPAVRPLARCVARRRTSGIDGTVLEQAAPLLAGQSAEGGSRERLFDAATALLRGLGARRPLALAFDDLQWIDEGSAALLHFIVRNLVARPGFVFACAARAGEVDDNACARTLLQSLLREGLVRRFELAPLSLADAQVAGRARVHWMRTRPGARAAAIRSTCSSCRGQPAVAARCGRRDRRPDPRDTCARSTPTPANCSPGRLRPAARSNPDCSPRQPACRWPTCWPVSTGSSGTACWSPPARRPVRFRPRPGSPDALPLPVAAAPAGDPPPATCARCAARAAAILRCTARSCTMRSSPATTSPPRRPALPPASTACGSSPIRRPPRSRSAGSRACRRSHRASSACAWRSACCACAWRRRPAPAGRRLPALAERIERAIGEAEALGLHDEAAAGWEILAYLRQRASDSGPAREATLAAERMTRRADAATHCLQLANSGRCLLDIEADTQRGRELLAEAAALAAELQLKVMEIEWGRGLVARADGDLERRARGLVERGGARAACGEPLARVRMHGVARDRRARAGPVFGCAAPCRGDRRGGRPHGRAAGAVRAGARRARAPAKRQQRASGRRPGPLPGEPRLDGEQAERDLRRAWPDCASWTTRRIWPMR